MTLPAFLLGMLLSLLYGAVFHLWRGGGFWRLVLYLVLGIVGFWTGHWLASFINVSIDKVGPLHLGAASIGSLIFLSVGYWLGKLPTTGS